jgi:hypothetical protein
MKWRFTATWMRAHNEFLERGKLLNKISWMLPVLERITVLEHLKLLQIFKNAFYLNTKTLEFRFAICLN